MRLTRTTHKAAMYACKHWHYTATMPSCAKGYNVYNDADEWCGVILFSNGANANISKSFDLGQGEVCELVRVALNGKQENVSKPLSMVMKQIKKDAPLLKCIVSYADIDQLHLGTIYQATNWLYLGDSGKGTISGFIINGEKKHKKTIYSHIIVENGVKKNCPQNIDNVRKYIDVNAQPLVTKGKRKYVMPLNKKMRKKLMPMSKPYPKNEEWVKIDRAKFMKEEENGAK